MVKEQIEKIRKRYAHYGDKINCKDCAVLHIRLLLEEIDRINLDKDR